MTNSRSRVSSGTMRCYRQIRSVQGCFATRGRSTLPVASSKPIPITGQTPWNISKRMLALVGVNTRRSMSVTSVRPPGYDEPQGTDQSNVFRTRKVVLTRFNLDQAQVLSLDAPILGVKNEGVEILHLVSPPMDEQMYLVKQMQSDEFKEGTQIATISNKDPGSPDKSTPRDDSYVYVYVIGVVMVYCNYLDGGGMSKPLEGIPEALFWPLVLFGMIAYILYTRF